MAIIKTESEFLFIGRGDESFLENYSYEMSGDDRERGGKIFMSLEILNNPSEAEDIGEAIFMSMKKSFFEALEKDAYARFEDAVKEVNKTLEEFKEGKVSRFIGNLNIVMAALCGDDLHLTQVGDAEAYLIRKRYVSIVSEGLGSEKGEKDTFVNIASGTLEQGDSVVLSSSRILRYVTKNEFGKLFGNELSEALTELKELLTTEILGRAAIIGLYVSEKEELSKEGDEGEMEKPEDEGFSYGGLSIKSLKRLLKWGGREPRAPAERGAFARMLSHFSLGDFTKDRVLIALVIVVVLLLSGIFWLRTRGNQEQMITDLEAKLTHVQEVINDAATQGQFDKERGAELLKNAETEALEVLNSRFLRAKASKMLDEIEKQREVLDNVKYVEQPEVYADLSTQTGIPLIGVRFLKDRMMAYGVGTLFEVLLGKVGQPMPISGSEEVILGDSMKETGSMVFITRSGKAVEYADSLFSFRNTPDGDFKKGVDMKSYNDKLYILDPARNQIWRYKKLRGDYGAGEAYNVNADLSTAVSLAIDASVYILHGDGSIGLLYAGENQNFKMVKEPLQKVESVTKIFTEPDMAQLFVLEPGKNRVLVYNKDFRQGGAFPTGAVYSTQYVFNGIGKINDFYVSRDENKLYVMTDSKIYVTSLNQ